MCWKPKCYSSQLFLRAQPQLTVERNFCVYFPTVRAQQGLVYTTNLSLENFLKTLNRNMQELLHRIQQPEQEQSVYPEHCLQDRHSPCGRRAYCKPMTQLSPLPRNPAWTMGAASPTRPHLLPAYWEVHTSGQPPQSRRT